MNARLSTKFFDRNKCFSSFYKAELPIIIFDVGANIGQSIEVFRAEFPNSVIHSFEPEPKAFSQLQKKFEHLDHTYLYNFALSEKKGLAPLHVNNACLSTSSLNPFNTQSLSIKNGVHPKLCITEVSQLDSVVVKTETIDNVIKSLGVEKINILKLDCQSYEPLVLEGARSALNSANIDFITTEITFDDVYGKGVSFADIENRIAPYGFRIYDICHLYKDLKRMRTHWVEAVYINTNIYEI